MVYYTYYFNNTVLYQNKLCLLNVFSLNLLKGSIIKLELNKLSNLNNISLWKAYYVLAFLINSMPKFLFVKIEKPHEDIFFNCLIYFYIPKKTVYIWLYNMKKLMEEEITFKSYYNQMLLTVNTIRFIKFYDLKTELFKWQEKISMHVVILKEKEAQKKSSVNLEIKYNYVL